MENILLQEFLKNQFIILENDGDFEKLQKVVEDVKKKWTKDKKKILSATLVALDPDVPSDNPLITEVQNVIIDRWRTFPSYYAKTKDSPVTCIRAVILEILNQLTESSESFAALIWHTGMNAFRFYKLGREEQVLRQFMTRIGNEVELAGTTNWQGISNIKLPEFKALATEKNNNDNNSLVDSAPLEGHLKAASSHNGWGRGGENPYTTGQNNYQWPEFFSQRAAKGIAETINKAFENQQNGLSEIQEHLNQYFLGLKPYFESIANSLHQSFHTLSLKNHLLWWKESLYSVTLEKSYRDMEPIVAVTCMARDFSDLIPDIYPTSVDYFLKETLKEVLKEQAFTSVSFSDVLKTIQANKEIITSIIPIESPLQGRKTMAHFIKDYSSAADSTASIDEMTGIAADKTVSLADLSTWLLHDFKAQKLTTLK